MITSPYSLNTQWGWHTSKSSQVCVRLTSCLFLASNEDRNFISIYFTKHYVDCKCVWEGYVLLIHSQVWCQSVAILPSCVMTRVGVENFPTFRKIQLSKFPRHNDYKTNYAICTCEIKSRIAMAKAASNKKKPLYTGKQDLNLRRYKVVNGNRSSTVVKVLCYNSEGRWFDCRWFHWNFSLT